MGILDKIQSTMCPDVWDQNKKLWPHIKTQILNKLYQTVSKAVVKEIFLIGSTTGFQWTETSDIDLNISIDPPELVEDQTLIQKRKRVNGFLAQGTRHPVNFFWVAWQGQAQFWGDAQFGVYDVLNDVWVADPGTVDQLQDPNQEFKFELLLAKQIIRQFETLVEAWLYDIDYLHLLENSKNSWERNYFIEHKIKELQEDTQDLIDFCKEWDRNRKFIYSWGYGTPRKSWQNIVFKALEESKYGNYFELFKELNADDFLSKMIKAAQEIINQSQPT